MCACVCVCVRAGGVCHQSKPQRPWGRCRSASAGSSSADHSTQTRPSTRILVCQASCHAARVAPEGVRAGSGRFLVVTRVCSPLAPRHPPPLYTTEEQARSLSQLQAHQHLAGVPAGPEQGVCARATARPRAPRLWGLRVAAGPAHRRFPDARRTRNVAQQVRAELLPPVGAARAHVGARLSLRTPRHGRLCCCVPPPPPPGANDRQRVPSTCVVRVHGVHAEVWDQGVSCCLLRCCTVRRVRLLCLLAPSRGGTCRESDGVGSVDQLLATLFPRLQRLLEGSGACRCSC
jgi:hypothetical protein